MNLWLSPNANAIEVKNHGHCTWCEDNQNIKCGGNILECRLLRLGYVKLSNNEWYCLRVDKMTTKQVDYIFDWCEKNKKEIPLFLQFIKD